MIGQPLFNYSVWAWIGIALLLFPFLLKITAPYGRYSNNRWGPVIDNRLGWFLMELPALVIFLYFIISYSDIRNTVVMLATILWSVHYFHRAIVFPLRIRTSGKKMPIIIMLFAFVFNLVNASLNGYWLGTLYPKSELEGIILLRVIVGLLLFITGFIINQYHDQILIRLRNSNKNGYKIPYGGFFRYISCPNFFGEIVEWGGFALLTWGLPSLSFFIWSMVNLIPRAIDHHKWYIRNFPEYPKERKAIIPFLY